ncbi:MAG TPA: PAS domain S-box protein, partial [Nitrospirota bacterium]|nr:PAS domain S-box protein [Nitrospirota bacterium]
MNCLLGVLAFWLTSVFYLKQVQVEQSLTASEEKYGLLFQKIPIGVFNYDPRLKINDCNDSFIAILRSRRNVLIGLDMNNLNDQRVLPALREAIKGTNGIYEGFYQATTSQAEIHIRMMTAPLFDQNGSITGGVGIVENITEQAKMKDSIREQKIFTDNLIENSAVATFVLDAQHKIVLWNKACEKLTGFPEPEMIGTDDQWKPFYDHKRPCIADIVLDAAFDMLPDLYTTYAKSTLVPNGFHAEGWYENLGGKDRYIHIDAAPIYDSKGELIAAIETLQDITERKQAEEEINRNHDTQAVINSLLRLSLEKVPLEDILNRALDLVLSIPWLVSQSRGAIFLVENDTGFLVLKAQKNLDERIQKMCARVPMNKCICGQAASTGKIVFVNNVDERHEISCDDIITHGHYCVPIIFSGKVLGVVSVYVKDTHKSKEREQELLMTISNTLAGIIVRRQAEDSFVESERKLQASEERLRAAVGVSQIGIFDHDQRTDTIYWSPQQRIIHGWGPDEPVTLQMFLALVHLEDREGIAASIRLANDPARDGICDAEHRIIRRDGTVRWLKERSQTFFEGEGDARRPVRTIGAVLDITERKKIEEEQQKLVSVIEMSRDFISIADMEGRILYMNAAGLNLVGLDSVEDSQGKMISDFLREADYRRLEREMLSNIFGTGTWTGELALRHIKTGMLIPVEMNLFIIKDRKNDKPIALANISRDATERKHAE